MQQSSTYQGSTLGGGKWIEGQRVMWLTQMKAAIDKALKFGSRIGNSRKVLDVLVPQIIEGGDAVIKRYEERRQPLQAA